MASTRDIRKILVALAWLSGALIAQAEDAVPKRLSEIWNGQRSEIATAHIRARLANTGAVNPLSPERLHALIKTARLPDNPDHLKGVVDAVFKPPPAMEKPWTTIDFRSEGAKTREDASSQGGPGGSRIFDGTNDINFDRTNRQIALYQAGASNSYRRSLDAFRFVPEMKPDALRVVERKAGRVVLEAKRLRAEVDEATGFVHRWSIDDGVGQVIKEVLQDGAASYPGGIVFPSVAIEADYSGGGLTFFMITVIEKAEFNQPMPATTFALAGRPGLAVFDRRTTSDRIRYVRIKEPTPSVVEYVDSRTGITNIPAQAVRMVEKVAPAGGAPASSIFKYVFIISLILVGILAVSVIAHIRRDRGPVAHP